MNKKKIESEELIPALSLGPDGYSRFFVLVNLLTTTYPKLSNNGAPIKILDVGGCSPYMSQQLEASGLSYTLTVLDILPKPDDYEGEYIQADITKANIPEKSFDVVISTDTLEHIPAQSKTAFVEACSRISKDIFILAAPFDTEGVHEAEELINEFNKELFGVGQDWLEEHFEYGKPTIEEVSKALDKSNVKYVHFGTNNIYSWVLSAHLNLTDAKLGLDKDAFTKAKQTYNKNLAMSLEFAEPTYRHFFVVYRNPKLYNPKPWEAFVDSNEVSLFTEYMHSGMDLLYKRMLELWHSNESTTHSIERLRVELENEKTHTAKLQQVIEDQTIELKHLRPFRHIVNTGKKVKRTALKFRKK